MRLSWNVARQEALSFWSSTAIVALVKTGILSATSPTAPVAKLLDVPERLLRTPNWWIVAVPSGSRPRLVGIRAAGKKVPRSLIQRFLEPDSKVRQ